MRRASFVPKSGCRRHSQVACAPRILKSKGQPPGVVHWAALWNKGAAVPTVIAPGIFQCRPYKLSRPLRLASPFNTDRKIDKNSKHASRPHRPRKRGVPGWIAADHASAELRFKRLKESSDESPSVFIAAHMEYRLTPPVIEELRTRIRLPGTHGARRPPLRERISKLYCNLLPPPWRAVWPGSFATMYRRSGLEPTGCIICSCYFILETLLQRSARSARARGVI